MRLLELAAMAAVVAALFGCAAAETNKPSAEALQSRTAIYLGVGTSEVKVSNIRNDTNHTYWVAATPKARYDCEIESGTTAVIGSLGIFSWSPECKKQ